MVNVRVVSFDSLRERLRCALGANSLIYRQLDRALAARDAEALERTMNLLARYPEDTRQAVQDAIAEWLFADGTSRLLSSSAADAT